MSDSDSIPRLISQPEVLRALLRKIKDEFGKPETAPAYFGALCQLIMTILDSDDLIARYEAVIKGWIWSTCLPGFPKDRFERALLDHTKRCFSVEKVGEMRALKIAGLSHPQMLRFSDELLLLQTSIETLLRLESAEGMEIAKSLEAASGGLVQAILDTNRAEIRESQA